MKSLIKKNYVYIVFGVCFLVCLFRAFKGFCWTDESFYYSTADRFFRGDALLKSEWYRTQCSSVFCLPFYALYVLITGSNAGVVLYFRILYLILSFTVAFVTFNVMKKDYSDFAALVMATLIIFYAHLNVTTFSYYMMSLDFLLLALVLIYEYLRRNKVKLLVVAGASFALSVLSMPALVVGYVACIIAMLAILAVRKWAKLPTYINVIIDKAKLFNILLYTFIGIIIPAIIFLIYMLSHVSVSEIITALPNILVDNEHDFTYGYLIRKFFNSIKEIYHSWTYVAYLMIIVTFVFQKWLKKKPIADIIVILDGVLFIILAIKSYGHTGYIQAAFMLFALPVYFLSNKKNHYLFWSLVPFGMILAVTYCFTSSDFLYVMAIGFFIVAIAGVGFTHDYVASREDDGKTIEEGFVTKYALRLASAVILLAVLYFVSVTIALRLSNVYRDAPVSKLTERIEAGPGKGLYTTKEHLDYYEDVRKVLDEYTNREGHILFSKVLPWGYMYTQMNCGYPTTWRATAYNEDQLNAYYEANPDKYPDIILVLDEEYGSYDAAGDVEDDHNPNLDEMNDYWKNYIIDNNMTKTDVACGVLYCK